MNRLVIIGNGFDLAHGLPTGYCDFINDYWRKIPNTNHSDEFIVFTISQRINFDNIKTFRDILSQLEMPTNDICYDEMGFYINKNERSNGTFYNYKSYFLNFKNTFFGVITSKQNIQNWVDIENEYYKLLKDCLIEEDNTKVKKLNDEFEQVKNLLEEYLEKNVHQRFDFEKPNEEIGKLLNNFLVKPQNEIDKFLMQFPKEDHDELIKFDDDLRSNYRDLKLALQKGIISQTNLILNFNYTKTFDIYENIMRRSQRDPFGAIEQIQIHGKLNDSDNKINFGFGDEMDKSYAEIEEKDDNEYLKNIKSFQYLQNSNYKKMLDFVESGKFQVHVMGHSCGLSDRILLNTIFEHHNCRSIKVFYYKKDDWDNYTDIVQNISRHFNKKKLMRDKIVNKSLCEALPQNIRFEEKLNSPE